MICTHTRVTTIQQNGPEAQQTSSQERLFPASTDCVAKTDRSTHGAMLDGPDAAAPAQTLPPGTSDCPPPAPARFHHKYNTYKQTVIKHNAVGDTRRYESLKQRRIWQEECVSDGWGSVGQDEQAMLRAQ